MRGSVQRKHDSTKGQLRQCHGDTSLLVNREVAVFLQVHFLFHTDGCKQNRRRVWRPLVNLVSMYLSEEYLSKSSAPGEFCLSYYLA